MSRSFLLLLLLAWSSLAASGQPVIDVEQEAAHLLAQAVENSRAAVQNINLYAELAAGRDPDDQETRLSMLTLAVASASRATAFFEIYDGLLARSGVQPPVEIADAIAALEQAMVIVPEAAGEALSAETAGDLPVAEIRERVRQMDEELSPHLDALSNLAGSVSAPTGSLVAELTRWRSDLQDHLEGDADELAMLFADVTNSIEVREKEITELGYEAGRLEASAAALLIVEETLGQEDETREDALEGFVHALHELGTEVVEDLVGLTDAERREVVADNADGVLEILGMLRAGAWRTDR